MNKLPALLKIKLREKEWTIYRLEKECGLHRTTLSRMMQGSLKKPSYESLKTLSAALDVDIHELLVASGQETASKVPAKPIPLVSTHPKIKVQAIPVISVHQANGIDPEALDIIKKNASEWIATTVQGSHICAIRWHESHLTLQKNDLLVVQLTTDIHTQSTLLIRGQSGIPELGTVVEIDQHLAVVTPTELGTVALFLDQLPSNQIIGVMAQLQRNFEI